MPSGPLNSIFTAVDTQITANLVAASITPTYGTTPDDRYAEAAPNRITWTPTDESIDPPRGMGGDEVVDSAKNMNLPGGANPPILTRTCTVQCDVWGPDRDTVDLTLIPAVYSAVHDVMYGSYGVIRAQWLLPDEGVTKDGETYRIWFQFLVPVTRVTPQTTTAVINTMVETPQFLPIVGP